MKPKLNEGDYVFVTVPDLSGIDRKDTLCEFREEEGITLVLDKSKAEELKLSYDFIAAWITLTVHSSLEAVGLTALFSGVLAKNHISCNVIAGYHHDHIFVRKQEGLKALEILKELSASYK